MNIVPDPSSCAPRATQALNSAIFKNRAVWPSGRSFYGLNRGSPSNPPLTHDTKQHRFTHLTAHIFTSGARKGLQFDPDLHSKTRGGVGGANKGEHRPAPVKTFVCHALVPYRHAPSSSIGKGDAAAATQAHSQRRQRNCQSLHLSSRVAHHS